MKMKQLFRARKKLWIVFENRYACFSIRELFNYKIITILQSLKSSQKSSNSKSNNISTSQTEQKFPNFNFFKNSFKLKLLFDISVNTIELLEQHVCILLHFFAMKKNIFTICFTLEFKFFKTLSQ